MKKIIILILLILIAGCGYGMKITKSVPSLPSNISNLKVMEIEDFKRMGRRGEYIAGGNYLRNMLINELKNSKRFMINENSPYQLMVKIEEYKPSYHKYVALSNSLGMAFVYIAPGSFMMGSPSDEPGRGNDETQRRVTLTKGFYMQTTEVTQGQWKAVMGNNPSYFKNCGDDCPVENVSWNDVQQFIRKLNQREGSGTYKLPTEAEWEYTARAGSSSAFANGGISELQCGFDSNLDAMGWYCGNSDKRTHPAARKQPNTWGLYDMHGNVYEWCQDWYGNYPSGSVTDPTGPSSGSDRVFRGGSWSYGARNCRSADRYSYTPGYGYNNLGFRILSTGVQAESGFVTAARTVYTPVQARFPASCNCTGSNRTNRSRD
jgi:formylglycine-generating enzyme required for sulfatase activity